MFQFQASLLDPVYVYQLAPRLWDFVLYTVAVSLIATQILEERFSKSKVFGGKSEKLAKTIGILLGLSFAFAMRLQNISFIGLAESGSFFWVFSALIGIVVYAWGTGSGWSKQKAGAVAAVTAGGSSVLLGFSSAGIYSNIMSFLMWAGIILILTHMAKKVGNPAQRVSDDATRLENEVAKLQRELKLAQEAAKRADDARNATVNTQIPIAGSPEQYRVESNGKWQLNDAGKTLLAQYEVMLPNLGVLTSTSKDSLKKNSDFSKRADVLISSYDSLMNDLPPLTKAVEGKKQAAGTKYANEFKLIELALFSLTSLAESLRESSENLKRIVAAINSENNQLVPFVEHIQSTSEKISNAVASLESGTSQADFDSIFGSLRGELTGIQAYLRQNETTADLVSLTAGINIRELSYKIDDLVKQQKYVKDSFDAFTKKMEAEKGQQSTGASSSSGAPASGAGSGSSAPSNDFNGLLNNLKDGLRRIKLATEDSDLKAIVDYVQEQLTDKLQDVISSDGSLSSYGQFIDDINAALVEVSIALEPTKKRDELFISKFSIDNLIKSINDILSQRGTP